jgi:hypothetical protein
MPTVPALKFKTASITPPKIVRQYGRESPYAPKEAVPGMWEALVAARKATDADAAVSPWVSFFAAGLPSEQNARTAQKRIREAVTVYADLGDVKKLAGRVWSTGEGDAAVWHFALSVRPGVLPAD